MRWTVFLITAYVVLAFDTGLRRVLALHSLDGISPSFVASLVVFVSLFAPRTTALWAAWLLGMLMDLSDGYMQAAARPIQLYLVGPYALGYVFGSFLILQLRALVFRKRLLTFALLTFMCVLAVSLVAVFIFVIRSLYPEVPVAYLQQNSAIGELVHRLGIAIYSALLAIPVGWLLLLSIPLWGFQTQHQRRGGW
jgi:cell shape-determining protein MreD